MKIRDLNGDELDSSTLNLNSREGGTKTFTLDDAYWASVSAGTTKLKVTAWVFHYNSNAIVAARELSCTKR